ncbi:polysaccharide pyruvyl transferase family protein [Brachyspira murdochii]|uniref:polysaccharide pyruvyl transferase family protein n=3 Tax=Brachyspira murdochii TaxID=84378 RepID=UPI003006A1A1
MLHYIHYIDYNNTGDTLCGYYNFFQELYKYNIHIHNITNINFDIIKKSDTVIIGGGGLLDNCELFNYNINKVLDLSDNVIFWSLGFHKRPYEKINENIRLDRVKLLSIRDYNHESKVRYIPCATCMIPYFDNNYRLIKRDIGVIKHLSFKKVFNEYETIENCDSIESIINFILTSNIILTNSYHAAYWATLMKKKVIVYGKFANKFDYLKYKPVEYSGNILNDIIDAIYIKMLCLNQEN